MFRWFFIVYFTLIHATGLLLAVSSGEPVAFLGSGLFVCTTRAEVTSHSRQNPALNALNTETPREHKAPHSHNHAQGEEPDHHHAVAPTSDVPFIHCDPLPAYAPGEYLTVPSELPETLLLPKTTQPEIEWVRDKPGAISRDEAPLSPPPKQPLR